MDTEARRKRLWSAASDETGSGALLVTGAANVAWLTGLASSNAAVLLLGERAVLATDSRYERRASELSDELDIVIDRAPAMELVRIAEGSGQLALGFEARHVTVAERDRLADVAGSEMPLVAVGPLAEHLRAIKDPDEVALLRAACEVSTAALAQLVDTIRVGETEVVLARRLETLMAAAGADDRSFPTIVAAGANAAVPHHEPGGREIRAGDLLLIDFGARVGGYHADCTRTFIVDAEPAEWQLRAHDVVDRAAAAARAELAPGVTLAAVDEAARSLAAAEVPADAFRHGTGHGVGLEVHEAPQIAPTAEGRVEAGQVVTIEPGAYLAGRGGVRIEDVCLVDQDGIDVLTAAPRELLRVG